jgi:hypothetical protein
MDWVLDIFIKNLCLGLGFSVIMYIIWRLMNPGKTF